MAGVILAPNFLVAPLATVLARGSSSHGLHLEPGGIIAWIIIGLIAGAVAGRVMRGRGYGCLGDIILGILGAFVGGFILSFFLNSTKVAGFIGTLVVAFLGAIVLIVLFRAIRGTLF